MAYKVKEHSRVCKYCGNTYSTNAKHSKVCSKCFSENHRKKVMNNLFN